MTAAPKSRLRRTGLRKTRTILENGVLSHGLLRFVHLDPPGLIRSGKITGSVRIFVKRPSLRRLRSRRRRLHISRARPAAFAPAPRSSSYVGGRHFGLRVRETK